MPLARYIVRRLALSIFVVFGVVTAVFVIQRTVPGDPAENILGEQATEADKAAFRERLGLNKPVLAQYGDLWMSVADGSFGRSFEAGERRRTVAAIIGENFPATVELAIAGVLVAIALALPLGLLAAIRPHSVFDWGSGVLAMMGAAIPNFWLGPLLLFLFAVRLDWFPDPGEDLGGLRSLVLPAIVLGTALSAKLMRMVRTSVLDVISAPYVVTARSKGLTEGSILFRHVLRNASIPVVTVLSLQFASLLTGAIITEKVFARPGLGTLLLDAVASRNYPVVQGTVIVLALVYIVVNLVTDVLYAGIDPRIDLDAGPSRADQEVFR